MGALSTSSGRRAASDVEIRWPDPARSRVYTGALSDFMDLPAVTAAYRTFLTPVRAKCRRMLGPTALAEDVAQETFARLLAQPTALDPADRRAVMAWLYRTSTRLAIDVLRARKRDAVPGEAPPEVPCGISAHDALAARSLVVALEDSVPADELEAALLARVDGLSQPEVAELLGISERTVRRRLDRFDERTANLRKEFAS